MYVTKRCICVVCIYVDKLCIFMYSMRIVYVCIYSLCSGKMSLCGRVIRYCLCLGIMCMYGCGSVHDSVY